MPFSKKTPIAKLGEEVLRLQAKRVETLYDKKIISIIKEMISCVKKSGGVGLAAPQIFHSYQIMIIASKPNERYPNAPKMENEVLINPMILETSEEINKDWEGCLSIPGIRAKVPRHDWVKVSYTNIDDETKEVVFEDFIARIFQHEYDHLIGKVFLDRVEDNSEIISEEVFFKMKGKNAV